MKLISHLVTARRSLLLGLATIAALGVTACTDSPHIGDVSTNPDVTDPEFLGAWAGTVTGGWAINFMTYDDAPVPTCSNANDPDRNTGIGFGVLRISALDAQATGTYAIALDPSAPLVPTADGVSFVFDGTTWVGSVTLTDISDGFSLSFTATTAPGSPGPTLGGNAISGTVTAAPRCD